jgi:hypothetical protein
MLALMRLAAAPGRPRVGLVRRLWTWPAHPLAQAAQPRRETRPLSLRAHQPKHILHPLPPAISIEYLHRPVLPDTHIPALITFRHRLPQLSAYRIRATQPLLSQEHPIRTLESTRHTSTVSA